jgi:hypothetical protein
MSLMVPTLFFATIDAHKGRDIETINIPCLILNAYNYKETIMLLKGHLAKLMVQVGPHLYRKYIIHNKKNQTFLYIKLTKAIFGLLKSALLFYRKFVNDLKSYSFLFVINPYGPCVTNATVGNKQMMVTWHVDKPKVSHINPFQVTKFAPYSATIYGNGLVNHHGPVHDYLGMDLNSPSPAYYKYL